MKKISNRRCECESCTERRCMCYGGFLGAVGARGDVSFRGVHCFPVCPLSVCLCVCSDVTCSNEGMEEALNGCHVLISP